MADYTELKRRLKAYTENDSDEFDTEVDTFLANGQLRILREVDINAARDYKTAPLADGDQYIDKPDDFVIDRWMKIDTNTDTLRKKDASFLQEIWSGTSKAEPRFYSNWDHDTFALAPIADGSYTLVLAYTKRLANLTSSNTTNWLGDNAEDVLLYAALIEAYAFMKSKDWLQFWEAEYQRAKQSLKDEVESRSRFDESRYGERR